MKENFECYEILQARAGNRFDCGEQCEECKEEQKLKQVQNPEGCDATTDEQSGEAGNKIPFEELSYNERLEKLIELQEDYDILESKYSQLVYFTQIANTKTPSIYPSDAIAFADWLHENGWEKYGGINRWKPFSGNMRRAPQTTEELYQLFKNHS